MILALVCGITRALSAILRRLALCFVCIKIKIMERRRTWKLTIFICKVQVAVQSPIMVEARIIAALFGCEDAIMDDSILEKEESLDCIVLQI